MCREEVEVKGEGGGNQWDEVPKEMCGGGFQRPGEVVASARRWMQVRSRFGGSNLRVFPPDGLCLISKYGQDLDIGA